MVEQANELFLDGLVHEGYFPIEWECLNSEPNDKQLIAANESNEQLLRLMTSLSEKLPEPGDDVEYNAELERLDLKLTVLLDMVGFMVRSQLSLPDPTLVKLGRRSMEWQSTEPPEDSCFISIKIYLDIEIPKPFLLYGVVQIDKEQINSDQAAAVRVLYLGLGENVNNELEKYIFRQHRKKIAYKRHLDTATSG